MMYPSPALIVRAAVLALPLALLWPDLRHVVESRMSWHMLGEFPALFASGWAFHRLGSRHAAMRRHLQAIARLDWRGWTGATMTSIVTFGWMVPALLDAALLSPEVAAAKLASWWLAGCLMAGSWRRMDPELVLFAGGNVAWMMATAGMLYLDAPARLCVNYLQDDQRHTGVGLLFVAIALASLVVRVSLRTESAREPRPRQRSGAQGAPDA
jgi:hypothetical protein